MESPAASHYDLFDSSVLTDPYPTYRRMQADAPIHWSAELGGWILVRHQDVSAALRDSRLSASRLSLIFAALPEEQRAQFEPLARAWDRWLPFIDGADHARLRTLVSSAFTPRVIAGMRPRIQTAVNELIDAVVGRGHFELIRDLAHPLPTMVITEMLGARPEDRDLLKAFSDEIELISRAHEGLPILVRVQQGVIDLTEYFRQIATERRAQPQDDLMSNLLQAEAAGNMLDDEELLATCALLLFAGHTTSTHLLANGMLCLLQHPDQLQQLKDDPALLEGAVEELLRYASPALLQVRTATVDLEIAGQPIKAGQGVYPALAAANRDPALVDDPDRFDITRGESRHLAFGYGRHFCIGSALARMEAQIVIETLLRRLPNLRLVSDQPEWAATPLFHRLRSLPLAFDGQPA